MLQNIWTAWGTGASSHPATPMYWPTKSKDLSIMVRNALYGRTSPLTFEIPAGASPAEAGALNIRKFHATPRTIPTVVSAVTTRTTRFLKMARMSARRKKRQATIAPHRSHRRETLRVFARAAAAMPTVRIPGRAR